MQILNNLACTLISGKDEGERGCDEVSEVKYNPGFTQCVLGMLRVGRVVEVDGNYFGEPEEMFNREMQLACLFK